MNRVDLVIIAAIAVCLAAAVVWVVRHGASGCGKMSECDRCSADCPMKEATDTYVRRNAAAGCRKRKRHCRTESDIRSRNKQ